MNNTLLQCYLDAASSEALHWFDMHKFAEPLYVQTALLRQDR